MKIIIPILVGAAIGYLTNWLAIKMLFRPLEEKKLFGFKLPFTPGLIPKERERIAKSIGEAVGMHLLTPEKIAEVVSSKDTKNKLREFIELKISDLRGNHKSISEIFTNIDSQSYYLFIKNINEKLFTLILTLLKNNDLKERLIRYADEDIYEKNKENVLDKIIQMSDSFLKDIESSLKLKEFIIEIIDSKIADFKEEESSLREIVSKEIIEKIDLGIDDNKILIMDRLRELFYKPSIQANIKASIEDLVEKNVSKMITMFIDSSIISEMVFSAISKYIDSPQAEDTAGFILKDTIENISKTKVSSITQYVLTIIEKDDISNMCDKTIEEIFKDENKEKILNTLKETIRSKDGQINNTIIELLDVSIDKILESENIHIMIKELIGKNINIFVNLPVSIITKRINDKGIEKAMDVIDKFSNTVLKEELFNVVNLFDVSKIVEDEINNFEVEYVEELILSIADKELKAITRLGALLGAIMGLLTPLLQML